MNQPAALLAAPPLLARLLDEQISRDALARLLEPDPPVPWSLWEQALKTPLADFVARPGKSFRARLVEAGWTLAEADGAPAAELVGIAESLHAGSLVLDDIEDGSNARRGAPALHVRYGVPSALNAGCWLLLWPHALLERLELPTAQELALRRRIGKILLDGHAGQALDLGVRAFALTQSIAPAVVRAISRLKAGGLVAGALAIGAIAGRAKADLVEAIGQFGCELGVGLQMLDDLGGLTRPDRSQKGCEDLTLARATWPFAWAATEATPRQWTRLVRMSAETHAGERDSGSLAATLLAELGPDPARRARCHVESAFDRLETRLGRRRSPAPLRPLLAEMIDAYV